MYITHTEEYTEYRAIYLGQIINLFKGNVGKHDTFGLCSKSGDWQRNPFFILVILSNC